jgi:hypothetical protein
MRVVSREDVRYCIRFFSLGFHFTARLFIPSEETCLRQVQRGMNWESRVPSTHESHIPWQQRFPFNYPLLFVIRRSEARNLLCALIPPRLSRATLLP